MNCDIHEQTLIMQNFYFQHFNNSFILFVNVSTARNSIHRNKWNLTIDHDVHPTHEINCHDLNIVVRRKFQYPITSHASSLAFPPAAPRTLAWLEVLRGWTSPLAVSAMVQSCTSSYMLLVSTMSRSDQTGMILSPLTGTASNQASEGCGSYYGMV